ncbi:MAG TPA: hypothetical protein PKK43_04150 [Spirochaetota bacterium]|nr:hypothetical protein [Spirochaetota bacterium]
MPEIKKEQWEESDWIHTATGSGSEIIQLFGVNIWEQKWKDLNETVLVYDNQYHQPLKGHLSEVEINGTKHVFAYLEYMVDLYFFFVRKRDV